MSIRITREMSDRQTDRQTESRQRFKKKTFKSFALAGPFACANAQKTQLDSLMLLWPPFRALGNLFLMYIMHCGGQQKKSPLVSTRTCCIDALRSASTTPVPCLRVTNTCPQCHHVELTEGKPPSLIHLCLLEEANHPPETESPPGTPP